MTCQTIQNRILALPDPRQLPGPFREHLDACPGCAAWWKQAAHLERLLELLPAPPAPADKKAVLIDDLTAAGPVIKSIPTVARGRSMFAVLRSLPVKSLAGLAAAVLVVVGMWAVFRPNKPDTVKVPGPRHPLLDKIVQRDVALAQAKTPTQRLDALSGLAGDLSDETRALARVANEDDLRYLASEFSKVVDVGIVKQADRMGRPNTPAERKARQELFDRLTAKLAETGQDAEQAKASAPPHAHPALNAIAEKARDAQVKLRAIQTREGI